MEFAPDQSANQLLASMPAPEWQRISPLLEAVDLTARSHALDALMRIDAAGDGDDLPLMQ
mgnify:CR=1 FL=1